MFEFNAVGLSERHVFVSFQINSKQIVGAGRKPALQYGRWRFLRWWKSFSKSWISRLWAISVILKENQKLLVVLWPLFTSLKHRLIPLSPPLSIHLSLYSTFCLPVFTPLSSFITPSFPPLIHYFILHSSVLWPLSILPSMRPWWSAQSLES